MTDLRIPTFPLSPRDVWGLALQEDLAALQGTADAALPSSQADATVAGYVGDTGTATAAALDGRFVQRPTGSRVVGLWIGGVSGCGCRVAQPATNSMAVRTIRRRMSMTMAAACPGRKVASN